MQLSVIIVNYNVRQFLENGIAIAGVDVGESYGSPAGRALYSALYEELTGRRVSVAGGAPPKPKPTGFASAAFRRATPRPKPISLI